MSNMADTSLLARRHVNITLGQQQIIDFMRARPKLRPTRQDIADLTRMKLQTVCARVNELLYDFDPPILRQLPAVDGKHPLELVEHTKAAAPQVQSGRPSGRQVAGPVPIDQAARAAAPSIEYRTVAVNGKIEHFVDVTPYFYFRPSLSLASAKRIIGDKSNAFHAEAERVLREGEHTVFS